MVPFDHDHSRGGAIPKRLLGEFAGYLVSGGDEGYPAFCRANAITQFGCRARARRKRDEVLKALGANPRRVSRGQPPA